MTSIKSNLKLNSEKEDEKREKRLERDRINARERRKRRKILVQDLESNVASLSFENANLKSQNERLCQEVLHLNQEISNLRNLCSILQSTIGNASRDVNAIVSSILKLCFILSTFFYYSHIPLITIYY